MNGEPIHADGVIVRADNKSVHLDEEPIGLDEEPVSMDEDSVYLDQDLIRVDEEPVRGDEESVRLDGEPVSMDGEPIRTDEDFIRTDGESVDANGELIRLNGDSIHLDGESVRRAGDPAHRSGETGPPGGEADAEPLGTARSAGNVYRVVMAPFSRSLLRSLLASVALLALLLGLAAAAITQPTFGNSSAPALGSADPERLRRHVEFLTVEASPRDSDHPENLDKAAAYVKEQLSLVGARVRDQEFTVRGRTYRNVIASSGPQDGPLLVVGAHYDSFGDFGPNPGADDNASGTAGLLELARLLAGRPLRHRVELVAYANEEPPWFGSPWMGSAVHARSLKGQDVRAMICLEMIGYFTETQPAPNWLFRLLYPERGDFIVVAGRWSDRVLTRQVKRAIRSTGFPVHSFTAPRDAGIDAPDQRSYWDLGIPAVMVTDTAFVRNPHYHTAGDTAETLDYGRMARVVEGVANAVYSFNTSR